MGETENKNTAVKESWFAGLKAEFKKIIWPTKESLARQTTAVVIVSVVLGLIITRSFCHVLRSVLILNAV